MKKPILIILSMFFIILVFGFRSQTRGAAEKCVPNANPSGPNTIASSCKKGCNKSPSQSIQTGESSATHQATCDLFEKVFPRIASRATWNKLYADGWKYSTYAEDEGYTYGSDKYLKWWNFNENKKYGAGYTVCEPDCTLYVVAKGKWEFNPPEGWGDPVTVDLLVNGKLGGDGGVIKIPAGETASLTWSSDRAVSCVASTPGAGEPAPAGGSPEWKGDVPLNNSDDSKYVYKIEENAPVDSRDNEFGVGQGGAKFKIKCCNNDSPKECYNDEVRVEIGTEEVVNPNLPSCDFRANPSSIPKGEKSTLSWTCENAVDCTLENQFNSIVVGFPPASTSTDSYDVSPSADRTYTLKCSNSEGSRNYSATVDVTGDGDGGQFPNPHRIEINPSN